jgi:hypothetical protein
VTHYFYERVAAGLVYDFAYSAPVAGGGFTPTGFTKGLSVRNGATATAYQKTVYNYVKTDVDPDAGGGLNTISIYKVGAFGEFEARAGRGSPAHRRIARRSPDWDNTGWTRSSARPRWSPVRRRQQRHERFRLRRRRDRRSSTATAGRSGSWTMRATSRTRCTTMPAGRWKQHIVDVDTDLVTGEPWTNTTGLHLEHDVRRR